MKKCITHKIEIGVKNMGNIISQEQKEHPCYFAVKKPYARQEYINDIVDTLESLSDLEIVCLFDQLECS